MIVGKDYQSQTHEGINFFEFRTPFIEVEAERHNFAFESIHLHFGCRSFRRNSLIVDPYSDFVRVVHIGGRSPIPDLRTVIVMKNP